MGYTTSFKGWFTVSPALTPEHVDYLKKFAGTRRVARNNNKIPLDERTVFWDEEHQRTQLGRGNPETEGEYYVDSDEDDVSVVDYNRPPKTQPSLYCQWVPTDDGEHIQWDGGEKFYCYVEWLKYICDNFLQPSGYRLNGLVGWRGEEDDDIGRIDVINNQVAACKINVP